jgi:hypothetical protein
MSLGYINLINQIPSGYNSINNKSIKDCNNEAKKNRKKYFVSGNDITKTNYACHIGDSDVPFTTEPSTNSQFLYKTANSCNTNNFPACLNNERNNYFKDIKKNELIKMAKILAYKNSITYNQDYDKLLTKYMEKIDNRTNFFTGTDILDDFSLEQLSLYQRLFLTNDLIRQRQTSEINLGIKQKEEKENIKNEYISNLDNIKSKIEKETVNSNRYIKIIQYLKLIAIVSLILMIILILYYIIKNPKNKVNNLNIINF